MEYIKLGLDVSRICLGCNSYGAASQANQHGVWARKTGWGNLFPGVTPERPRAVLQKLVKVD